MKAVKRYMEIILTAFLKKILIWGKCAILDLKIVQCRNSKDFFEILHNERGQEVHGTYINGFPEKISFGVNGPFWPENVMSS